MAKFTINAINPKGLAYSYQTSDATDAHNVISKIIARGATNVTVNGEPIPN